MTSHQEELKSNTLDLPHVALTKNTAKVKRNWVLKQCINCFLRINCFKSQHSNVILLSRACWSGHAYETCLCAFWKISPTTCLLELLFCYFKEMTGIDELCLLKKPSLYALQKIESNFVVQMSSLPSPVCLACHREGRDDKLPLSDGARHESHEGGCLGDK